MRVVLNITAPRGATLTRDEQGRDPDGKFASGSGGGGKSSSAKKKVYVYSEGGVHKVFSEGPDGTPVLEKKTKSESAAHSHAKSLGKKHGVEAYGHNGHVLK